LREIACPSSGPSGCSSIIQVVAARKTWQRNRRIKKNYLSKESEAAASCGGCQPPHGRRTRKNDLRQESEAAASSSHVVAAGRDTADAKGRNTNM
jgi:hypothetical protein